VEHKLSEHVNVKDKTCSHPDCMTRPTYGISGTKVGLFCKEHKLSEHVDVKNKTCSHPNCTTRPVYGISGTKVALFCTEHKLSEHVDVINKTCSHPNCTTIPTYGISGTKIGLFCKEHKLSEHVDVKHKTCSHPDCMTQPNFNFLGFTATYCGTHRSPTMVYNPKKRCSSCKNFAISRTQDSFTCADHQNRTSIPLSNICPICCSCFVEIPHSQCVRCASYDGKTLKTKLKELTVKNALDDARIHYSSYDKRVEGGCSARRPDFIITTEWGNIVLEVDEFQHRRTNYPCECEITRMKQIYFDIGSSYLSYIRYNPDPYKPSYSIQFPELKRLDFLTRKIKELTLNKPENPCEVLYLFYDGFTHLDVQTEIIEPYYSELKIQCFICEKVLNADVFGCEGVCPDCMN